MKYLDAKATEIFYEITRGLGIGGSRTIDNTEGTFMAVHINRLQSDFVSIAHYFEQNGDLCCDPDMTFRIAKEGIVPIEFQQAIPPVYQNSDDESGHRQSQVEFANMWMRNIADQQCLESGLTEGGAT